MTQRIHKVFRSPCILFVAYLLYLFPFQFKVEVFLASHHTWLFLYTINIQKQQRGNKRGCLNCFPKNLFAFRQKTNNINRRFRKFSKILLSSQHRRDWIENKFFAIISCYFIKYNFHKYQSFYVEKRYHDVARNQFSVQLVILNNFPLNKSNDESKFCVGIYKLSNILSREN